MKAIHLSKIAALVHVTIASALLSGCGAGGSAPATSSAGLAVPGPVISGPALDAPAPAAVAATTPVASSEPIAASTVVSGVTGAPLTPRSTLKPPAPTPTPAPQPSGSALTEIKVESLDTAEQRSVPVTFAHPFAQGHVSGAQTLVGKQADGTLVPLQVESKAVHPDGSVRHAVISAMLPTLAANAAQPIGLYVAMAGAAAQPTTPATLLAAGFTAAANITLGGAEYSVSADALLRSGKYSTWLSGPIVNEWHVSAPLTTAQGIQHPHLSARFAIRAYRGNASARVDVTIENNWAYEAAPQNFVYDAKLMVGGAPALSINALEHAHHARWRKVFWWGAEPRVHLKHNAAYLIATKSLPNYDQSVVIPESTLSEMKKRFTGPGTEPMGAGLATAYMPATGGRPDIGLLPGWAATYLLSMDKRAKDATLGTADLAGGWSAHYRNRQTDRPISLLEYPYMTILGHLGDTYNPATKKREAFPTCAVGASCANTKVHDSSHQPGFAYLPYLVTGDYYYLEELQFWAMWNTFSSNPGYRDNIKGLMKPDQVRGQAWSMRTLSQAAYITPDNDPLKSHFHTLLNNNLDWYNANYTNNPATNKLGVLTHGYAIVYDNKVGLAPWMDDFFTSAIGYTKDLGFEKAAPLLQWKSKFPISRMIDEGTCWVDASIYAMKVRDSETSPLYTTMKETYQANHTAAFNALPCAGTAMGAALKLKAGEMTGYSSGHSGYPSNLQPALAYAAEVNGEAGKKAWAIFMGRSVKPNYGMSPQFAIVPR